MRNCHGLGRAVDRFAHGSKTALTVSPLLPIHNSSFSTLWSYSVKVLIMADYSYKL